MSFDAYFEFEIWGQVLVHNEVAIQLTGTVPHWPPPADISLKAIEPIELLDENGQSSGFQAISLSLLVPPPPLPPPPPVFVALPSLFPSALSGLVLCLLLMGGMASQRFARPH